MISISILYVWNKTEKERDLDFIIREFLGLLGEFILSSLLCVYRKKNPGNMYFTRFVTRGLLKSKNIKVHILICFEILS